MVNLIRLYLDMTFEEKKKRTEQDKIRVDKGYTPNFKIGTSVFRERPRALIKRLMFWSRPRNLVIMIDGAPSAMHLETVKEGDKPSLAFNFGTMKDTTSFLYKVVAKSKSEQKPISNTQFLVLALLIGAVLMFQFMLMKGVKM